MENYYPCCVTLFPQGSSIATCQKEVRAGKLRVEGTIQLLLIQLGDEQALWNKQTSNSLY